MKKLKSLTIYMGENAIRLNNMSHKDGVAQPTPIHFDEEKNTILQYKSSTERTSIDLSKVLMFTYEEEAAVIAQ